jgi:hypothetical protein
MGLTERMKMEKNVQSTVSTKYMYEKIYAILDDNEDQQLESLSKLLDELALTFKNDTGFTVR